MTDGALDDVVQPDCAGAPAQSSGAPKFFLGLALTGFIPILTGTAYLVGVAYHQTYLNSLRVPSSIIAKSAAEYFLYAHSAITNSLLTLLGSAGLLMLTVLIYAALWRGMSRLALKLERSEPVTLWQARVRGNPRVHLFGDVVLLPVLFSLIAYLVLIALLFALVLPPYVGEAQGKQQAQEDLATFKLGCEKARGTYRFCSEIREGDKLLARGFIIDSSEKYVAIYDAGTAHTYPIEGKHFVVTF